MTPDPTAYYETLAAGAAGLAGLIGAVLGSRVIDRLNWLFNERKRIEEDIAEHYVKLHGPYGGDEETRRRYTLLLGKYVDKDRNETIINSVTGTKLDHDAPLLRDVSQWAKDYSTGLLPRSYWLMFGGLLYLVVVGIAVPLSLLYGPVASPAHIVLLAFFVLGLTVLVYAFRLMLREVQIVSHVSWPTEEQLPAARRRLNAKVSR